MDDKELAASLSMLTVQFSAMNQILMGLLMVLDPAVLKSIQETIQESAGSLEEGSLDQMASTFAIAQLSLAVNGPRPKTLLTLVKGKES